MMLQRVTREFRIFYNSQKFSGVLLIFCTAVSLYLANSALSENYLSFWHNAWINTPAAWHLPTAPVAFINDVLMAVFFLLVGMEIKREAKSGELSSFQRASLPVAAAVGGMLAPALIYWGFNQGTSTAHGWGIPMATDIAFALGVLSLLGNRVPDSLKVLLTALAVADDLGAVLVIALFYSGGLQLNYLLVAGVIVVALYLLNRFKVQQLWPYLSLGLLLWYCIHLSGIHATISGVLLAMMIPYDDKTVNDPLQRLEHALHIPVSHIIMPLFALANTAIVLEGNILDALLLTSSLGIMAGLLIGKPLGIMAFVWLSVKTKLSKLPFGIDIRHIIGMGLLGGIGFTMSIFVSLLAFADPGLTDPSKLAILTASTLSGIIGFIYLNRLFRSA